MAPPPNDLVYKGLLIVFLNAKTFSKTLGHQPLGNINILSVYNFHVLFFMFSSY